MCQDTITTDSFKLIPINDIKNSLNNYVRPKNITSVRYKLRKSRRKRTISDVISRPTVRKGLPYGAALDRYPLNCCIEMVYILHTLKARVHHVRVKICCL